MLIQPRIADCFVASLLNDEFISASLAESGVTLLEIFDKLRKQHQASYFRRIRVRVDLCQSFVIPPENNRGCK
jgi:hypothetical protein